LPFSVQFASCRLQYIPLSLCRFNSAACGFLNGIGSEQREASSNGEGGIQRHLFASALPILHKGHDVSFEGELRLLCHRSGCAQKQREYRPVVCPMLRQREGRNSNTHDDVDVDGWLVFLAVLVKLGELPPPLELYSSDSEDESVCEESASELEDE